LFASISAGRFGITMGVRFREPTVLEMLKRYIKKMVEILMPIWHKAKDKDDSFRLMGFGQECMF
jgi:hypothetical protein